MKGLIATVLVMSISFSAYAFELEPMNRAYPMVGKYLVSDQMVDLESYRGKWVLLEFWASW